MFSLVKNYIAQKIDLYFVKSEKRTRNYLVFTMILLLISRIGMLLLCHAKYGDTQYFIERFTVVYDNGWFRKIILNGYDVAPHEHAKGDAANWPFFPLAPMLIKMLSFGGMFDYRIVGIFINTFLFALALTVAYRYATDFIGSLKTSIVFTFIMVFGPYSFYFSSLYSEALFMLLTMIFLYLMRSENYILMGITGALLSATRVTGVFVVVSVLIYIICKHVKEKRGNILVFIKETLQNHQLILGVCLVPMGLFAYMLYLKIHVGDALAFMHIQKAWGRHNMIMLDEGVIGAIRHYFTYAGVADPLINFHYILVFIAIVAVCCYHWSKRPYESVPYFFPLSINYLSSGVTNTARYSLGTGIFVLGFTELVLKLPKWVQCIIYMALVVCSYYMLCSWFEGHYIVIG